MVSNHVFHITTYYMSDHLQDTPHIDYDGDTSFKEEPFYEQRKRTVWDHTKRPSILLSGKLD